MPVLSVELSDTNATHTLIQAQSLSDTTTIRVTSENTLHTQNHKVHYIVNSTTVNIKNGKLSNVEIYPNPFSNTLKIVAQGKKYSLVTSKGQELVTGKNVSEISTIDLPAGMYFVIFEDSFHKVIKQ